MSGTDRNVILPIHVPELDDESKGKAGAFNIIDKMGLGFEWVFAKAPNAYASSLDMLRARLDP